MGVWGRPSEGGWRCAKSHSSSSTCSRGLKVFTERLCFVLQIMDYGFVMSLFCFYFAFILLNLYKHQPLSFPINISTRQSIQPFFYLLKFRPTFISPFLPNDTSLPLAVHPEAVLAATDPVLSRGLSALRAAPDTCGLDFTHTDGTLIHSSFIILSFIHSFIHSFIKSHTNKYIHMFIHFNYSSTIN